MNQKKMLEWVQMLGFCVTDMKLYLDTHTEDTEGFAYFKEASEAYRQAIAKYEENFGPLTAVSAGEKEKWDWSIAPLPWEGGH